MTHGYWLSWVNATGFVGVVILPGESFLVTRLLASTLKIAPTGIDAQCIGIEIDFDLFPKKDTFRLLNQKETNKYV